MYVGMMGLYEPRLTPGFGAVTLLVTKMKLIQRTGCTEQLYIYVVHYCLQIEHILIGIAAHQPLIGCFPFDYCKMVKQIHIILFLHE